MQMILLGAGGRKGKNRKLGRRRAGMRIFEYLFMQRAFVAGICWRRLCPGVEWSLSANVFFHDRRCGLSHTLPSASQQTLLGVSIRWWRAAACGCGSVLGIEAIRKLPRYWKCSISIITCQQELVWRVCCPVL